VKGIHQLDRPKFVWNDNINMDLKNSVRMLTGCMSTEDRIQWGAVVNTALNPRSPQNAGNFLNQWETISLSTITHFYGANNVAGIACNDMQLYRPNGQHIFCETHRRCADLTDLSRLKVWAGRFGVRIPAEARNFSFLLIVQTGSGAHEASYSMGTGVISRR
jgi:hypothetical protein